jgi:transcriptional regulator with XRE-family HTH domain
MNPTKKTTAILLTGGVALASAAYGIGTQVDGGEAVAGDGGSSQSRLSSADRPGRFHHPPGPPFEGLADDLGVDADKLEDALRDFHEQEHNQREDAFATALGDALGKSAGEVKAAFEKLEADGRARFAERLADQLGVDAADVESALEKLRDERPRDPWSFADALADELGVDAEKVEDALAELRPDRGERRHLHGFAPLRRLAGALDVTPAQLRDALREVRTDGDHSWRDNRDELAEFLAQRLGISADKVKYALPDLPPPGPGPGRHPMPPPGP